MLEQLDPEARERLNKPSLSFDPDGPLQPWDKAENEDYDWYECFLYYLKLGEKRSLRAAAREWLVAHGKLLPGEPVPAGTVYNWGRASVKYAWYERARLWDRDNCQALQIAIEEERRQRIAEISRQTIDAWESFKALAVQAVYQRDEEGHLILDEDGNPKFKEVENAIDAVKIFKMAAQGSRVELGLPNELWSLKAPELAKRWREGHLQLQEADEDIVDADVSEVDDESS